VIVQVGNVNSLTDGQVSEVIALSGTATQADEVAPLSEQVLLAVRDRATSATTNSHFLASAGTRLAGYAHLDRGVAGQPGTAELVVDPSHRRQGVGTALIRALEETALKDAQAPQGEAPRIWSHGDLDGARALAQRDGYSIVRELWQMRRSLRADAPSLPGVSLPGGFRTRHFVVGQDEDAWLRVNSRAFVDHPEQGRMTRQDLDQRIAQEWFEAKGLLLIEDTRGRLPVLAASHWTKVVPAKGQEIHPGLPVGEVYVVGVDPDYQGLGLGRTVTVLGLAHLRARGLAEAMLYVDADNRAAVATYSRLDFARTGVDIMYSRTVHIAV
jgi:mycothiol synthase